jgi:hypothetical protein
MEVGEAVSPGSGGPDDETTGTHRVCLRLVLAPDEEVTLQLAASDGSYDETQRATGSSADEAGLVELAFEDVDPACAYTLSVTPGGDQPAYDVFEEVPYARLAMVARSE